ncbi:hypothetical protein GCM10023322_07400 [Rugosimonospora acidiphila]|uniref:LapA family protein n=1 Tax=Rugosimonospora acidiphila TaxID=556531 RepID=A0ABP9RL60_9ACTN
MRSSGARKILWAVSIVFAIAICVGLYLVQRNEMHRSVGWSLEVVLAAVLGSAIGTTIGTLVRRRRRRDAQFLRDFVPRPPDPPKIQRDIPSSRG